MVKARGKLERNFRFKLLLKKKKEMLNMGHESKDEKLSLET